MKKILAIVVLVASFSATFSSDASAWYCVARSATGARGWATNYILSTAQYNALWQCAARTPRGYMCYIRSCR